MVERVYRNRGELYLVSIDFEKAYDSIRREKIIEILKDYRIQGEIIDFISRVYRGDSTVIGMEDNREIEIDIDNGIRQGCTASTVIFKLVTYKIIEELNRGVMGYG